MKIILLAPAFFIVSISKTHAQESEKTDVAQPGMFSLGTRNTFSMFNDDNAVGKGIGGQFRLQFSKRINTEWYFDYITSKNKTYTTRNDYHIGWSIMYYPGNTVDFSKLLQPYLIAGHCFDLSKIKEQNNPSNYATRTSMATQAGVGTHINITPRFDCTLSMQYMIHFGKDIETIIDNNKVLIQKKSSSSPDGHLLGTISFNYKLFQLWKSKKA